MLDVVTLRLLLVCGVVVRIDVCDRCCCCWCWLLMFVVVEGMMSLLAFAVVGIVGVRSCCCLCSLLMLAVVV